MLPISEKLAKKLPDYSRQITRYLEKLESVHEWEGISGWENLEGIFDDPDMVANYLSAASKMFFEEAPMNQEPEEAGHIMAALDDAVSTTRRHKGARDTTTLYELLGDALSEINYVIETYT